MSKYRIYSHNEPEDGGTSGAARLVFCFGLVVVRVVYLGRPPCGRCSSPTCCFLCLPLAPLSSPVIPEHVRDNGRRAGTRTSGAPVPQTATSASSAACRFWIWCVMIWQSGVDELGITETRPPAPRRPTGWPYGRRRSALNSSSSLLTLLLARSSFLMNPCFHLRRSEDSALVIPHVSHCFISPF